ncbi:MAG TPA: hypothetical protein VGE07_15875 [Herpetosiphonaceae bacterium]
MTEQIPAYLADRLRQAPPPDCRVVPGSTPVVAFGPFRHATVATLGLNPSKHEFLDPQGHELTGAQRRLETLASLGVASLIDAPDVSIAQVLAGCNGYFHRNPYRRWFNHLQRILDACGVSYAAGTAAHLDLSQWATNPIWRDLPWPTRERLLRTDTGFLRQQLDHEQIEVVLLNGRGVIDVFQWAFNLTLSPLPERLSGGRLHTELVMGTLGHCAVIGWSTNLQSSFGVTRELRARLAETVGGLVDQARHGARQRRLRTLVEERTAPPSERREVVLQGTTTIDGAPAPCYGRIRLKQYPRHLFAQWGINRMDGTLPAYEFLTLPLAEVPASDNPWGTAVQRVLDAIHAYQVAGQVVFTITSWAFQEATLDAQEVQRIIQVFRAVQTEPRLLLGAVTISRYEAWRRDFSQGVAVMSGHWLDLVPEEIWWAVAQRRGWVVQSVLPWRQMQAREMDDAAIIDELLTIEIAAWERTYGLPVPAADNDRQR